LKLVKVFNPKFQEYRKREVVFYVSSLGNLVRSDFLDSRTKALVNTVITAAAMIKFGNTGLSMISPPTGPTTLLPHARL
jgi:hypothetical protein